MGSATWLGLHRVLRATKGSILHGGSTLPTWTDKPIAVSGSTVGCLGGARLRAAIRRAADSVPEVAVVEVGDLTIDLARKRVARAGNDVPLTPTDWVFLELLTRKLGRLVTREQTLREVWGPAYQKEPHYLRVYAAQLRRKLEDDPAHPRQPHHQPGLG